MSTELEFNLKKARSAGLKIASLPVLIRNNILEEVKKSLTKNIKSLIKENNKDIQNAEEKGLSVQMIKRLELNEEKVSSMIGTVESVISQPDPLGKILREDNVHKESNNQESKINIQRISCPIGVIAMIYESRPNVTLEAAILGIKSGNAMVLRGGSDSYYSSKFIANIICEAIATVASSDLSPAIYYLQSKDRQAIKDMLTMDKYIDMVIPRGGRGLIEMVSNNTKIAVLKHLDGNCHSYVHRSADLQKALDVVVNAKTRSLYVCCATETILIDETIANDFLPKLDNELTSKNCELRCCMKSYKILNGDNDNSSLITQATEQDYYDEFLDSTVAIKIVKNHHDAIEHINNYSSGHTEAIIANDNTAIEDFFNFVNSAVVMVNASTQFSDGNQMGLGAEIGISTDRLHARGPVGLEGLTIYKYKVTGDYSKRIA